MTEPYYSKTTSQALEAQQADRKGLTDQQARARLEQYGPNKLAEGKKDSLIKRFFQQMGDPMIIILLVAAAISGVLAVVQGESFADVIIILAVVIINAVLGVYQESKAEKALDALKNMSAPHARVLRNGKTEVIDASLLVPGDIIHLEAGDFVPADARLLDSSNLKSEELSLIHI